ncbi:MAG: hypothetical protein JEY79_18145 [Pseudodesulfovibrio sp.]|nr:hypothetical protein [Pseudodesulfovibrio sp.]
MQLLKNKYLIAATAVVVLACAYLASNNYAVGYATDRIESFLIKNNLDDKVKYDSVSASIFGSACINNVTISDNVADVKVGSICVNKISEEKGSITSLSVSASGFNVPLASIAGKNPYLARGVSEPVYRLLAVGATDLVCKMMMDYDYDPSDQVARMSISSTVSEIGSVSMQYEFDHVRRSVFDLYTNGGEAFPNGSGINPLAGLAFLQKTSSFSDVRLADYSVVINNEPYVKRFNQIKTVSTPEDKSKWRDLLSPLSSESLVKNGMMPSDAAEFVSVYNKWKARGGEVEFSSDLKRPLPLVEFFTSRAAGGAEGFFGATNSRASM